MITLKQCPKQKAKYIMKVPRTHKRKARQKPLSTNYTTTDSPSCNRVVNDQCHHLILSKMS